MDKRQIDALVCEKVMGLPVTWRWCAVDIDDGHWSEIESICAVEAGPYYSQQPCYQERDRYWRVVDCYTENIAEAWDILAKIREMYPDVSIGSDGGVMTSGWMCTWGMDGHGWASETADTAPEAICKAALAIAGIDVEG